MRASVPDPAGPGEVLPPGPPPGRPKRLHHDPEHMRNDHGCTSWRRAHLPTSADQVRQIGSATSAAVFACTGSSNADDLDRTDANHGEHIGAYHPKHRTASDGFATERARLLN
jgi:hypothetical protein